MAQEGIKVQQIALFALCTLPSALRIIWSFMVDAVPLPFLSTALGQRRAWLLTSQLLVILLLFLLSLQMSPLDLTYMGLLCTGLSFAATIQHICSLSYQVEELRDKQFGVAESIGILGYRIGMLLAGAGAFYLSAFWDWDQIYQSLACFSILGPICTLVIDPPAQPSVPPPLHNWLQTHIVAPIQNFKKQPKYFTILLVLFLYCSGDHLIVKLQNVYFSELGFSAIEIANAIKLFGMGMTISSSLIAGLLLYRYSLKRCLWGIGFLHALSFLSFIMLYHQPTLPLLYLVSALEHFTGGMHITCIFTLQLRYCNPQYAATHLGILGSCFTLNRILCASSAGWIVTQYGWPMLFSVACLISLVSLYWVAKLPEPKTRN